MVKDKKTAVNAAGSGCITLNAVASAAEQLKAFEAVTPYRSVDALEGSSHSARTHTHGRRSDTAHQQLACMAPEFVAISQFGVGLTVGYQQHAVRRLSVRVAKLVLEE